MTTRSTANYSGTLGFHSIRKYKVVWFYDLMGVERSYRFRAEDASLRTEKLLKRGFKLKADPFARGTMRLVVGND